MRLTDIRERSFTLYPGRSPDTMLTLTKAREEMTRGGGVKGERDKRRTFTRTHDRRLPFKQP